MLFVTIPHSGERVPEEAIWLKDVAADVLLTDVDRFVHELYGPACDELSVPWVMAEFHRYAVDLNRIPSDIDESFVEIPSEVKARLSQGAPQRKFASGFHWVRTTTGVVLLKGRIPWAVHVDLVKKYYDGFHKRVLAVESQVVAQSGLPRFHIDAHSMPSRGTGAHKDAGQTRPDIVVSDCSGSSCSAAFKDLVIAAYEAQGFSVAYNWPYLGGRMTEQYGKPGEGRHSVQVELNRALYMDEATRGKSALFLRTAERIRAALSEIKQHLPV